MTTEKKKKMILQTRCDDDAIRSLYRSRKDKRHESNGRFETKEIAKEVTSGCTLFSSNQNQNGAAARVSDVSLHS